MLAWAKRDRDHPERWHSLVAHSADVSACFLAIVETAVVAERLAALAGHALGARDLARLTALAFLHDFGKANWGFQRRSDPKAARIGHLAEIGGLCGDGPLMREASRFFFGPTFETWCGDHADDYLLAILAHHGRPIKPADNGRVFWRPPNSVATPDPLSTLRSMMDSLREMLPEAFEEGGAALPASPGFIHGFAGLLQLADWLGSDESLFQFSQEARGDRFAQSLALARTRLRVIGFARPEGLVLPSPVFGELFRQDDGPMRALPLQQDTMEAEGRLVLLEAETGAGKTEAALLRFARLYAAGGVDGLYFALPTRVAANQMFRRVQQFARGFLPESMARVLLAVPGDARLEAAGESLLQPEDARYADDSARRQDGEHWAAERAKRFLAARIAVGTVDQALLGALQVKHAHLRAACLSRSLLVVDEVHASDLYMSSVLRVALKNHLAAGGCALLMSATLGARAAAALLSPADPKPRIPSLAEAEALAYPAIRADSGPPHPVARSGRDKAVEARLAPLIDDAAAISMTALEAARRGAKVLIIRNTVAAAQAAFTALEAQGAPLLTVAGRRTLHHGRFARVDRRALDTAVEAAIGKTRPKGGLIIVGTQTLEQSLDIDADWLITDLCPMDVLLQRIGRLHRHRRETRPDGFESPRVVVLAPPDLTLAGLLGRPLRGFGDLTAQKSVYPNLLILRATADLLSAHGVLNIPADNRTLVERATHPEALDALQSLLVTEDPRWRDHRQALDGKGYAQQGVAGLHALDMDTPFVDLTFPGVEEHVLTRLGASDRILPAPGAPLGPFGERIEELVLPGHWGFVAGLPADATASDVHEIPEGFEFQAGVVRLRYGRMGLQRAQSG